jgi:16S rRNA processing protein RimM
VPGGTPARPDWVEVGVVGAPVGVRGAMRIMPFTANPEDIVAYGTVHAGPGGPPLALTLERVEAKGVVARARGIQDRDAATALRGTRLYVPRAALPPTEPETYYHHDLIGLGAETPEGTAIGTVVAVVNHGAGDVLEIAAPGRASLAVAFTTAFVPVVDLAARRVVIDPAALDEGNA